MDLIGRLAKGLAAVQATVGTDETGPQTVLVLDAGGTLHVQARRRRDGGLALLRIETPLGEGLARIDLARTDARALAAHLLAFADGAADEAKPVGSLPPDSGSTVPDLGGDPSRT